MTTQDNAVSAGAVSTGLMKAMNPAASAAKSGASAAETQDRFMKLLITQMKNQDPLNPMDNAQVTSQLAQLSTVTGIDKMNTTLESLMGSFQSNQSVQAAGMIGRSVLIPGKSLGLADGKAAYGLDLAGPVDSMQVTIRDAAGVAVRKIEVGALPAGTHTLQWDGKNDKGSAAAAGQYTFEIAALAAGKSAETTALAIGRVDSVSTGTQGVKLNVNGVGAVNMTDIRQII